jgi:hypothetical protein
MDIRSAASLMGKKGGSAGKGVSRSGRPRKYPKCTAPRHRFHNGKCSKCGLAQS